MRSSASAITHLSHLLRQVLRSALLVRHRLFAWYLGAAIRPDAGRPLLPPGIVESILVIRLDEIGDFVLTTPFLRAIRAHYAHANITLLVKRGLAALARTCPDVDEVMEFPAERNGPPPFEQLVAHMRAKRFARTYLLGRKFQYAISPRIDVDMAGALAMAYYARIPYRIGYGEAGLPLRKVKDAGYDRFLTHRVLPQATAHDVISALRVAEFCGAQTKDHRVQLWPDKESRARVDALLAPFRQPDLRLVAIAPGASLGRRRWPVESFAGLVSQLITHLSAQIVVVGGSEDVELGERLMAVQSAGERNILSLAGCLRLQESAALLGCCSLFIGNDSGPMHMAAAMGVPCVEISCHPLDGDPAGPNSPVRFSPWGVPHRVLQPSHPIPPCGEGCSKSYAHCIKAITIEQVLRAAQELVVPAQSPVGLLHEQRIV